MTPSVITRGLRALVCLSLLGATGAAVPSAQQATSPPSGRPQAAGADVQFPALTFKAEVNYVEVDAVVTDQQGRFVGGLRPEDFDLAEDGKPQSIASFGVVNVPIEYAEAPLFVDRPIEPDVATNIRPFEGRVYVIVLDDLHTGFQMSPRLKLAAKRFVERQMGANDIAAVVSTGGNTNSSQEFTGNRRLLAAAIDRFMGRSLGSTTASRLADYNRQRGLPTELRTTPRDTDDMERAHNARSMLTALRGLSELLAGVHGRRKALILFSEGLNYDLLDTFQHQWASQVRDELQEAIAAASRANVAIYAVDPRGLSDIGTDVELSGVDPSADPALRLGIQGLQDEMRLQHDSLTALSEETGGFAVLNTNDTAAALNRVRDENSHYYLIGYYPTNERRDGRFRKIEVRVKKPGLQVRARKGYVAARGKSPAPAPPSKGKDVPSPLLREAMNSPLPIAGLRLRVFAAPFKGTPPNASVAVVLHTDGHGLKFTERDGRLQGGIEVSITAVDTQGKIKNATRQRVSMPLKPESLPTVTSVGVRSVARIDVPPGRYQLRVAALDEVSQAAGSVFYDLEVPDFAAGPLGMSGIVLTSSRAANGPVVGIAPDDEWRRMLPAPPTVQREFRADEELALMAEVYDNQGGTAHKVAIATTFRSDDGREVFRVQDERESAELGGRRGGYGYTARVPLKGLAPGLYVLKVEAKSTLGRTPAVSRQVMIRVLEPAA